MLVTLADPIENFIARWIASEGKERANFQPFAEHLCEILGVDKPSGSIKDIAQNVYAYERDVDFKHADGATSKGRIDLYKRGCFVLEAKQSWQKGGKKELKLAGQNDLFVPDAQPRGKRSADRAWDVLMLNAKRQAEDYAKALPSSEGWPPFLLVCDVGHCIEVYADFSGQGKNYAQFPDRNGYRIYLEDLRDEKIRERLRDIWTNPLTLDPALQAARVTRGIAKRLAKVSRSLEARSDKPNAEDVAHFLMRCLFTMFAEDVKLLPENCFRDWLGKARDNTSKFKHELAQLWQAMDKGGYATIAETEVKRFNGAFFKSATVFDLGREEIGELWEAAKADWKQVDPAIFGTLLEQALDAKERAKLGAHYTPRAYVERLVVVTILEPLRNAWAQVQATAERLKEEKRGKDAIEVVRAFHKTLCETRVLDPACGTGNFLFVSMELMKRLEGEVLEALLNLGGAEALALEKQTVDPHQFLGIEKNSRAAAIAELVIWLGFLQWHFRTKGGMPNEPILRDFNNIQCRDAVLDWDGYPVPKVVKTEARRAEAFPNARKPKWPEAEYIVGNPPFIGGSYIRSELGNDYAETLWGIHGDINDSADFVMYWWDRAASLLTAKGTKLQRFGFVTTNSITQVFSRRTVAKHLDAKKPISLLMAIPDHPWTKATDDAASVRIAMTVAAAGRCDGVLREVTHESGLESDDPRIELVARAGKINSDLTLGADVAAASVMTANECICHDGVKLHGSGFIVTPYAAETLGLGKRPGLEKHIRHYRNGRDLTSTPRGVMVIDLFGLDADDVRKRFPEVYQHLMQTVKPERDVNNRATYRDSWWIFGEPRKDLRPALAGLPRYIGTTDTAKHRVFQFLDGQIICDDKVVVVASADAFHLGVLSSRVHVTWALRAGGTLEDRPVYTKSICFDPYPFPDCSEALKAKIRAVAEELDSHRKARQAEQPRPTLTQMYNVLEKLKSGESLNDSDELIKQQGLVLILKELHEKLDVLVFEAYGWAPSGAGDSPSSSRPPALSDEEILQRLVALNKERAAKEKAGTVRWLSPDFQIPRFGSEAEQARLKAERAEHRRASQSALALDDDLQEMKPKFPTENELAETAAVMRTLAVAAGPLAIADIARHFSQGLKVEKRVALTILALARLGHISSEDSGQTFALRRAA